MNIKREVIGEGAYGCVLSPSIHCSNTKVDYTNKVSKIMKTNNAEQELREFVFMSKIDPTNDYHLGTPTLCKPNLKEPYVVSDIQKCTRIDADNVTREPKDYSLLVLQNGGPDLKMFCYKTISNYLKRDKQERTKKFWLEVRHLLKGLQFFRRHGLVHNDVKPQNILFNTNNGKMRYIDFGTMRPKSTIVKTSKKSTNGLSIYHWSYPLDCGTMNKNAFQHYKSRAKLWEKELSEIIVDQSDKNTIELPILKPESFRVLFTYLNPKNSVLSADIQKQYIHSFFQGYNSLIHMKSYDQILDFTVDSIDVYGLGITLQFIANCFKRHNALTNREFTMLSAFFNKMYSFNPLHRVVDIDALIDEYDAILQNFNQSLIDTGRRVKRNHTVKHMKKNVKNRVKTRKYRY